MEAYLQYRFDDDGVNRLQGVAQYDDGTSDVFTDFDDFKKMCATSEFDPLLSPQGLIEFVNTPSSNSFGILIDWYTMFPRASVDALFPYQRETIERVIYEMDGKAIFAAEAGMGKTFTAIMIAFYYYQMASRHASVLVVAPLTTHSGWVKEFKTRVNVDAKVLKGGKTKVTEPFVITGYDTAKVNAHILSHKWTVVIFDESHLLKNVTTQRAATLIKLGRSARCTILLSGTPRLKCNSELYTQIQCVLPSRFDVRHVIGTYEQYIRRYCNAQLVHQKRPERTFWSPGASRYNCEIFALLTKVMIRITRSAEDLAKLPPLNRVKIEIELEDGPLKAELEALRIKGTNPALSSNDRDALVQEQWRKTGAAKFPFVSKWCLQWLKDHPDDKLVIFAHSVDLLERYQALFNEAGYSTGIISGKVPLLQRAKVIESIANLKDKSIRVGLLSFGTCALGVTLCPGAHTCVFAELMFTPALMEQSEAKLHRVGMIRDVTCYWMIAKGTIDNGVMCAVQKKTNGNSECLDNRSRKLYFDQASAQQNRTFWSKYKLTEPEIDLICISRLPRESDEAYFSRVTVEVGEMEDEDIRRISCPYVSRPLGVKATVRGLDLVAILEPVDLPKRHKPFMA